MISGPANTRPPNTVFDPRLKSSPTHELLAILDTVGEMVDIQIRTFTGISLRSMGKVGFRITQVIAVILIVILISIVGRSFIAQVQSMDFSTHSPLWRYVFCVGLTAVALTIGLALSDWKSAHKLSYGFCEVLFGIAMSASTLYEMWGNARLAKWLALMSAIYIISRGISNARESLPAASTPALAQVT